MDLGSVNAPPPLDHRLPGVAGRIRVQCNGRTRSGITSAPWSSAREDSTANSTRGQVAEPRASSGKRQALTGGKLYSIGL